MQGGFSFSRICDPNHSQNCDFNSSELLELVLYWIKWRSWVKVSKIAFQTCKLAEEALLAVSKMLKDDDRLPFSDITVSEWKERRASTIRSG